MRTDRPTGDPKRARPIGRRRMLAIAGCAAGLAGGGVLASTLAGARAQRSPGFRWRGVVLGAAATITVVHEDRSTARRIVAANLKEIDRLEDIFSLYRPHSALARLNLAGSLTDPPAEMLDLLSQARRVHAASEGVFDPTVQPLWRLYADHFAGAAPDPAGPGDSAIAQARRSIGFDRVAFDERRIAMPAGFALTLNGIAQGYIADRVAVLMRAAGLRDTLIDLGEIRALGTNRKGRPWRAGIAGPGAPQRLLATVDLDNKALATSAADGTRFDPEGRHGHILDPRTGRPARINRSASVRANSASLADALSTAMIVLPPERGFAMVGAFEGADALLQRRDGRMIGWA